MKFEQITPTDLTLQARDWVALSFIMKDNNFFYDLLDDLKTLWRVATPPAGATNVQITATPLNKFLKSFYFLNDRYGKQVFKNHCNRIRAAIEALNTTETVQFFTDFDAEQTATENAYQEVGRKILRGKLG